MTAHERPVRTTSLGRDGELSERGKSLDSLPAPPPVPVTEPTGPSVQVGGQAGTDGQDASTPPTDYDG